MQLNLRLGLRPCSGLLTGDCSQRRSQCTRQVWRSKTMVKWHFEPRSQNRASVPPPSMHRPGIYSLLGTFAGRPFAAPVSVHTPSLALRNHRQWYFEPRSQNRASVPPSMHTQGIYSLLRTFAGRPFAAPVSVHTPSLALRNHRQVIL